MNDRTDAAEGNRATADSEEPLPPPPPPRGADQAVWVGLFLVLGLVASLAALFVLTDAALFRGRYIVTTNVPDAGGIRRGDPVQMLGVNIGRVQRFQISQQGVAIRLEIEGEYPIPRDSVVYLKSTGPLGGMTADVVPGHSAEMIHGGETLTGQTARSLGDATTRITTQMETVLGRLDTLLSPALIQNVQGSGAELQKVMGQLSVAVTEQRRELSALSQSLRRSSSGLERVATAPELDHVLKRLDTVSQRMDEVTASLGRSSQSVEGVLQRTEHGEGTLGKLTRDESVYNNLNKASADINQTIQHMNGATEDLRKLMEDIRKNPRRYFKFSVF
jgi:phospholipid/cholesterol/gamma-HCH transport system substrate-binding protein